MKKMLDGSQRMGLALLACVVALAGCSSSTGSGAGERAFVAPERVRVRSSTAEAARTVGEIKSGEEVTVTERRTEGNTAWANINGPNNVAGWVEAQYLVKGEIVKAAQKIAEETRTIPTQAVGKSKARLKLRLTPDRSSEENVAYMLPAGTVLEIVARARKPRPEKLDQRSEAGGAVSSATAPGPKYDDWYQVRLKSFGIVPAGWIYGGSVELDVPGDISFFTSTGRRITGWQKIGATQDELNQTKEHYLVAEKQLFGADDRLDFDRLKVLAFDPKRREYYTPFREDVQGRFPLNVKIEGSRGQFQVTALDKESQPHQLDYTFEFLESGRPKITRVTPKESGRPKAAHVTPKARGKRR